MATRTPSPTTPGTTRPEEPTETQTQRLVDIASEEPSAVTESRAVRPPVAVRNKRLAEGFGEAFLVWRCLDCGTLGSLDALPARCVCGARREALAYVVED
jgi:rubrerythrin